MKSNNYQIARQVKFNPDLTLTSVTQYIDEHGKIFTKPPQLDLFSIEEGDGNNDHQDKDNDTERSNQL